MHQVCIVYSSYYCIFYYNCIKSFILLCFIEQAVAKAGKRQLADEKKKGNLHKGKKKKEKRDRAKPKARKFGFFANLFAEMGIGTNVVQLTDPYALEAAQALDLRPYHLRILQAKFNRIDIDGSGSIDVTEFLDSVGERRSPFTDKLFALIGKIFALSSFSMFKLNYWYSQ